MNETQTETISTASIPEAHEVIVQGFSGHNAEGKFALHFSEIQI